MPTNPFTIPSGTYVNQAFLDDLATLNDLAACQPAASREPRGTAYAYTPPRYEDYEETETLSYRDLQAMIPTRRCPRAPSQPQAKAPVDLDHPSFGFRRFIREVEGKGVDVTPKD